MRLAIASLPVRRYLGMRGDVAYDLDTERACLRIRLAAAALATTLTLFAGSRADPLAAATIPVLVAIAVVLRYVAPHRATGPRAFAGHLLDVVAVTAIVYALPVEEPAWVLYAFVIANGALRSGPLGAFAATAGSIVGYDVVLSARVGQADLASLWIVQALVAIGLVGAELAWSVHRATTDRGRIRRHTHALRSFTQEAGVTAVLEALRVQLLAAGAEDVRFGPGGEALRRALGGRAGFVERLPTREARYVSVALPAHESRAPGLATAARDLIADAAPLIAMNERREHDDLALERAAAALQATADTARETTEAGALATLTVAASKIGGRAAIVRLADGVVLTGDVAADAAVELARGAGTAALLLIGGASWSQRSLARLDARSAAVVSAGQGRALLALAADRDMTDEDLSLLQRLATAAGSVADTLRERDRLRGETRDLRTEVERIGGVLQAREDSVAMAVHELRNPLTSVHGYATLMTRNLSSVQDQMRRLEQIIADLLGRSVLGGEGPADVAREAREAIARLRTLTGREAALLEPADPARARIDPMRLAQVLDNLLRNAAKYSPESSPISLEIAATEDEVRIAVRDDGAGIEPADLGQLFIRGFRSPRHAGTEGEGLGLAVCQQIVEAQGGRIWAESVGRDRGSTFHVALPRAVAVETRT